VRAQLGGPPEAAIQVLARANGKSSAKSEKAILAWANSQTDRALAQRSFRLMRRIMRTIRRALPRTDPELIGGICAHLFDLWETGQTLNKRLQKVSELRLPRDRERLRDTLIWIEAIQLDMASFWIGEVKKGWPKLLKALDQEGQRAQLTGQVAAKKGRKTGSRAIR